MPVTLLNREIQWAVERRAWVMRTQENRGWQEIAELLGLTGESVARAYAKRYAERNGLPPLTVPNPRRQRAAQVALQARFGTIRPTAVQRILTPQLATRTFGIEIEYVGGVRLEIVAEAIAQALEVPHIHCFRYHQNTCFTCRQTVTNTYGQWKVETDASVHGEVVSPVLMGEDGFKQIQKVMKAMKQVGCKTNKQCGQHIHIGMQDTTREQRYKVVTNFNNLYPQIRQFVARSRWTNHYCKPMDANNFARLKDFWARGIDPNKDQFGRTFALNVTPFPKIGTYEVRLHQGTLNPKKIITWIKFLTAFVEFAKDEELNYTVEFDFLNKLLEGFADPNKPNLFKERDAQYLKARATELAGRR